MSGTLPVDPVNGFSHAKACDDVGLRPDGIEEGDGADAPSRPCPGFVRDDGIAVRAALPEDHASGPRQSYEDDEARSKDSRPDPYGPCRPSRRIEDQHLADKAGERGKPGNRNGTDEEEARKQAELAARQAEDVAKKRKKEADAEVAAKEIGRAHV